MAEKTHTDAFGNPITIGTRTTGGPVYEVYESPEELAQEIERLTNERNRYRTAWTHARARAAEFKRLNGVHHYLMESYGRQARQCWEDLNAVRREAHLMAKGGTGDDYVRGVVAAREDLIEAADAGDAHTDERMLRASLELTRNAIDNT